MRWSLGAALLVGAWLVAAPTAAAPTAPLFAPTYRLAQVWPAARIAEAPARLSDGADYRPQLYVDPQTAVGTAQLPDHTARRVVLRSPAGERELHRVDAGRYPQFFGFTTDGADVYWAESTTAKVGAPVETRLWRAPLTGAPATELLPAPTDGNFYGSEDDLEVADGRVYWTALVDGPATEIRSVPAAGGPVTVRRVPGEYRLSAWPWLRTVPGAKGPLELLDPQTGVRRTVVGSPAEQLACDPAWCRSVVTTGSDRTTLFDLVRTDGTDRRHVGGPTVTAAVPDVARLDRFEPVLDGRRLALYDLAHDRTVTLAADAGPVAAAGALLWWQTPTGWHSLDLATLP